MKFPLDKGHFRTGGRAAEIVLAKEKKLRAEEGLTYGPSSDLKMATYHAAQMVCKWGMYEEEIGLAVSGKAGFNINGELELECDEKEKEFINRILSEQLKEAIRIIEVNKDAMERLVKAVMDSKQKYLTEKEIQKAAGELNRK